MAATALADDRIKRLAPTLVLGAIFALVFWAYWNSLIKLSGFWDSPKYSHGYLVPLFTLSLLWLRRDPRAEVDERVSYIGGVLMIVAAALIGSAMQFDVTMDQEALLELLAVQFGVLGALLAVQEPLPRTVADSARWTGVGLIVFGIAVRLVATRFSIISLELPTVVPVLMGVVLLVGGWSWLRWAGGPIAFLLFMFPLPGMADRLLLGPLQRMATESSTYCLQTLGIPAVNDFNKILLGGDTTMEVVEACSGLRMLTIFGALATALTMVTDRPMWEKGIIVVSAIPIALSVNIVRITVTGILYKTVGPEAADRLFHVHDTAGWLMMPLALGLLYIEFQILTHLFVDDGLAGPMPIANERAQPVAR